LTVSSNPNPQPNPAAPYGRRDPIIFIKMLDKCGSVLDIVHIDRRFNVTMTVDKKAREERRAARKGKPRARFQSIRLAEERNPARTSRPGQSSTRWAAPTPKDFHPGKAIPQRRNYTGRRRVALRLRSRYARSECP
jgi:hypothetical protein